MIGSWRTDTLFAMSDSVNLVIALSERVLRLRKELVEAEAELEGVVRGKPVASRHGRHTQPPVSGKSQRPAKPTRSSTPRSGATPAVPVSQKVAKYLVAHGASDFSAVFRGVQPAKRGAVKSALNKGRERGDYAFRDGKYDVAPKTKKAPTLPRRGQMQQTAATT